MMPPVNSALLLYFVPKMLPIFTPRADSRNVMTPMKLTVQQLQRLKGTDRFDTQFDKATSMLISEMDNLSRIATSFSTFAKQPEVQPANG